MHHIVMFDCSGPLTLDGFENSGADWLEVYKPYIMENIHVSISKFKRDISAWLNRVAYGGERVMLTSRGKPKAAVVSMDDYERLTRVMSGNEAKDRLEAWLEASDTLATKLASKRDGKQFDADAMIAAAKADLEERHDFLRDD